MTGSDSSPEFLKTGLTDDNFQQAGKLEAARHLLYSLERTGASSGAHFLMNITGIPSGLHALWGSGLEVITEAIEGVICISLNRDSVLLEKLGRAN